MCRSDRRCPLNNLQKLEHNARRRANRRLRKNIAAFAEGRDDVPSDFTEMPINKQVHWAMRVGAGPEVFAINANAPLPRGRAAAMQQDKGPQAPAAEHPAEGRHHQAPTPPQGVHEEPQLQERPKTRIRPNRAVRIGDGGGSRAGQLHEVGHPRRPDPLPAPVPGGVQRDNRVPVTAALIASVQKDKHLTSQQRLQVLSAVSQMDAHDYNEVALNKTSVIGEGAVAHSGVNDTRRLIFSSGGEGYFKAFGGLDDSAAYGHGDHSGQQPVHEVAAWQLARNLGPEYASIVAPCAFREHNGHWGSVSQGTAGSPYAVVGSDLNTIMSKRARDGVQQIHDAAFYDALIGNGDRHGGNFLINQRGLTLIDHGFAFHTGGVESGNWGRLIGQRIKNNASALTTREREHLDALLASKDAHGMAGILEDDRLEAMLRRARIMRDEGNLRAVVK